MPNIKIINREPEGGETVSVSTYDFLKNSNENKLAGVQDIKPGEELELLVNADRWFSVAPRPVKNKSPQVTIENRTSAPLKIEKIVAKDKKGGIFTKS